MQRLLLAVVVAALAWSGWWALGWQRESRAFAGWIAARQAEGWQAETAAWRVQGFPNRFDLSIDDLALADPETGLGWQAPRLQVSRLSYGGQHRIVSFPARQTVLWPGGAADLASDRMQASLIERDGMLDRATLVAEVLNVSGDAGAAGFARLQLSLQRSGPVEHRYDIALMADGFAPDLPLLDSTGAALPQAFETVRARGAVIFDRAWDRRTLSERRPQPVSIALDLAELSWGPLSLRATGELSVDAAGRPSGEIAVQARNWREMLERARASGQVPGALLIGLEQGLALLSRLGGTAQSLDLTLTFEGGRMYAGPIPLGDAPVLAIR